MLTCSLKVRFESNIIPRSLTEGTGAEIARSCCEGSRVSTKAEILIPNFKREEQQII